VEKIRGQVRVLGVLKVLRVLRVLVLQGSTGSRRFDDLNPWSL
jgi:hypothetical protein